jgi:hypothetical protein
MMFQACLLSYYSQTSADLAVTNGDLSSFLQLKGDPKIVFKPESKLTNVAGADHRFINQISLTPLKKQNGPKSTQQPTATRKDQIKQFHAFSEKMKLKNLDQLALGDLADKDLAKVQKEIEKQAEENQFQEDAFKQHRFLTNSAANLRPQKLISEIINLSGNRNPELTEDKTVKELQKILEKLKKQTLGQITEFSEMMKINLPEVDGSNTEKLKLVWDAIFHQYQKHDFSGKHEITEIGSLPEPQDIFTAKSTNGSSGANSRQPSSNQSNGNEKILDPEVEETLNKISRIFQENNFISISKLSHVPQRVSQIEKANNVRQPKNKSK